MMTFDESELAEAARRFAHERVSEKFDALAAEFGFESRHAASPDELRAVVSAMLQAGFIVGFRAATASMERALAERIAERQSTARVGRVVRVRGHRIRRPR
jgi:hypothetical protein